MSYVNKTLTGMFHEPVAETSTIRWIGASSRAYDFQLHPIGVQYLARAGVYIFCKQLTANTWRAIYIGETNSFERRLTTELRFHHQWLKIASHGATHICTLHVPAGLATREAIETDLRRAIVTPCNEQ